LDPETAVEHGDLPSSFVSIADCSATIRTYIEFPISCCGLLPLWPYPRSPSQSGGPESIQPRKIASHLLCGKTIEQAIAASAAQIVLAAAAVGAARRVQRIPGTLRGIIAQPSTVEDHYGNDGWR
jgi:hypothetical protein